MRYSTPSKVLESQGASLYLSTIMDTEKDSKNGLSGSMIPTPPATGDTGITKEGSMSPEASSSTHIPEVKSATFWRRVAKRRRVVLGEMKERRMERAQYIFPMRGMTGERFGQHVDLIQKQNANFGVSAIFMAGLQAQLLSILPDESPPATTTVWITALFYTAVLLDTLAALFSIWSTLMYNNAVAAPITNLFDDDGDPQNKSKRAAQWGKAEQPYTALVNLRAGYVLQSIFAWFFLPGIICMVIGLLIFVWSHQPKAVAWASSSVVLIAVLCLPMMGVWNGATAVSYNPSNSPLRAALVKAGCELARTGNHVRNAWGFPIQKPTKEDIENAGQRSSSES